MDQQQYSRRVNKDLTSKVIALHSDGYVFDFAITGDSKVRCIQDNRYFSSEQISVKVVDLRFDYLCNAYKYIHTVETCCGDKGLLIDSLICVNAFLDCKSCRKEKNYDE